MKTLLKTIAILGLATLSSQTLRADGLSMNNTLFDTFVTSNSLALDANFKFELGAFDTLGGFTPSFANTDIWEEHWKPFAVATEPGGTYNPAFGAFSVGATLQPTGLSDSGLLDHHGNAPVFTTNEVLYLWTYDTKSLAGGAEWSLLTGTSWRFPDPAPLLPSDASFSLNTATTAIVGNFTADLGAPDHNSMLQTANIAPVPEPGSIVLLAIAGLLARFRRTGRARSA